jgi:HK97 family phage prohead protease
MAIKQGREYRALQDFSLVPRDEGSKEYRVRGTAIVFNSPTVLWECDGVEYKEIIDRHAFDECDMSDVIFNYNHGGKVIARLRNKTLALNIDERGVNIDADLGGTTAGRELYEEIDGGYVDKMSFSFTVREASYDSVPALSQRSKSYTTCRRWTFPPIMTRLFRLGAFSRRSTRGSLRLWSKPGGGRNS